MCFKNSNSYAPIFMILCFLFPYMKTSAGWFMCFKNTNGYVPIFMILCFLFP